MVACGPWAGNSCNPNKMARRLGALNTQRWVSRSSDLHTGLAFRIIETRGLLPGHRRASLERELKGFGVM